MHRGIPLTDEDRWPWLENSRELIKCSLEAGENAVLACSALKRAYREPLRVSDEVKFVFLIAVTRSLKSNCAGGAVIS